MKLQYTDYVAGGTSATLSKARANKIATAIASLLTKTADTGQINWPTVTWVGHNDNTVVGYEIYRFNDSLQSSAPLFIKIEYGTGNALDNSNAGRLISLWITIGKGSDGTGNLTGILQSQRLVLANAGYAADGNGVQGQVYVSNMDGSGLTLLGFPNAPAVFNAAQIYPGFYLVVERSRDAGGNATADGVFFQYASSASANDATTYDTSSNHVAAISISYASGTRNELPGGIGGISFNLNTNASIAMGSTIPVFSGLAVPGDGTYWAPRSVMATALANFGGGQVITSLLESRDYVSAGFAGRYSDLARQQFATAAIAWY